MAPHRKRKQSRQPKRSSKRIRGQKSPVVPDGPLERDRQLQESESVIYVGAYHLPPTPEEHPLSRDKVEKVSLEWLPTSSELHETHGESSKPFEPAQPSTSHGSTRPSTTELAKADEYSGSNNSSEESPNKLNEEWLTVVSHLVESTTVLRGTPITNHWNLDMRETALQKFKLADSIIENSANTRTAQLNDDAELSVSPIEGVIPIWETDWYSSSLEERKMDSSRNESDPDPEVASRSDEMTSKNPGNLCSVIVSSAESGAMREDEVDLMPEEATFVSCASSTHSFHSCNDNSESTA